MSGDVWDVIPCLERCWSVMWVYCLLDQTGNSIIIILFRSDTLFQNFLFAQVFLEIFSNVGRPFFFLCISGCLLFIFLPYLFASKCKSVQWEPNYSVRKVNSDHMDFCLFLSCCPGFLFYFCRLSLSVFISFLLHLVSVGWLNHLLLILFPH